MKAGPRARLPEHVSGGVAAADHAVAQTGRPRGPERTCVGCRHRGLRSDLVRVVVVISAGRSRAEVDVARRAPGRGAWLHADLHCLELAERRRAFARALRTPTLDASPVRARLEQDGPAGASTSVVHREGSGLEADGYPMSTQR